MLIDKKILAYEMSLRIEISRLSDTYLYKTALVHYIHSPPLPKEEVGDSVLFYLSHTPTTLRSLIVISSHTGYPSTSRLCVDIGVGGIGLYKLATRLHVVAHEH